jgi:hypothetical protein
MDFYNYITVRDACSRAGVAADCDANAFYERTLSDALAIQSAQFFFQLNNERDWEQARRPFYNVWPSIVPMLTKLMHNGICDVPVYTYSNFPREKGLTVEQSLASLGKNRLAELGVQIPSDLVTDCVRLCCSLCLLENAPSVIEPDALSKDRDKFEQGGDQKYVDKAHRRGKIGWNVGRHIEVAPHYRRPHMALVWTGRGRTVPKIVPRRGSVVHRELIEKVPSGFGGEEL